MRTPRLLAVVLLATACGGGKGPSSPSVVPTAAPTPAALAPPSFRDGATDQPVSAAISPPAPTLNATVTVRAPGFLPREQRYDGQPIFLWPGDEGYVRELVYQTQFTDGSLRMIRWARGFTFTLDGDLADDAAVVAKAQEVATEITRVTGLPIAIGPGGACLLVIDASDPALGDNGIALARRTYQGANIVSGRVVFRSRSEISGGRKSDYRNTLLHEMGHVMGLYHSPNDREVMTPGSGPGAKEAQFQEGEAACLRMMYLHRQAGNFPPDRDPALGTSRHVSPRTEVIVD